MDALTVDHSRSASCPQAGLTPEPPTLCQVYPTPQDEAETDVDIIAIHGLDAESPDTWALAIGYSLSTWVKQKPTSPVHRFMTGWHHPESGDATGGVIFLATPFRGTVFKDLAGAAVTFLRGYARLVDKLVTELLESMTKSTDFLQDLMGDFTRLVDKSSARLDIVPNPVALERTHVEMNKFYGPEDPGYVAVSGKIKNNLEEIRDGSPLKTADDWIREDHYTADRLKIKRLSGELLPMGQCYINLAIVEHPSQNADHFKKEQEEGNTSSSPFSILARLKVETPDRKIQVELPTLFNARKGSNYHMAQPRRILIRGRAGVGKTTLCKKIVHDFIQGVWRDKFDRVLWVRLRRLKGQQDVPYNLGNLLYDEYFSQHPQGVSLASSLWRTLVVNSDRTLFILDGLDEVIQNLSFDDQKSDFLQRLLNQPNVIITSRPHISLPVGVRSPDLELETIGFYPDQVTEYIQNTFTESKRADEIQKFLQKHQLIHDLARIPIQLDALCYTWSSFRGKITPRTMTDVYKSIEVNLWKKDILRLEKQHEGMRVSWSDIEDAPLDQIENFVSAEIYLLEGLAFTGLYNDVIEFTSEHRSAVSKQFKLLGTNILLDRTLPHLSFLRTSDPSSDDYNRDYHFLHVTFQEYFAARYFVRQWKYRQRLKCLTLGEGRNAEIEPSSFIQNHKYNARCDIFWRFVAGLLNAEETFRFFQTVEEEPRDLIGPMHQRLIMHCLSEVMLEEVSIFTPLRTKLEVQLSQWLLFECKFRGGSHLANEKELPEQALKTALQQSSGDTGVTLLRVLNRRSAIPLWGLEVAASCLKGNINESKAIAALNMLGSRKENLSSGILQAMASRLEDPQKEVRQAAVDALKGRSELPPEILQAIAARFKYPHKDIRLAAVSVLKGQLELNIEILQAIVALLEDTDIYVRQVAVNMIKGRAELPLEVVQAVAAQLEDPRKFVHSAAVNMLRGRSELPAQILQAIVVRLEDPRSFIRLAAVRVLEGVSELHSEILHAVARQINDPDKYVRQAAVNMIGRRLEPRPEILQAVVARLEDPEVLQAIAARLQDSNKRVRYAAVKELESRPELPSEILQAVESQVEDSHNEFRQAAVEVLMGQYELPPEILQAMASRLQDPEECVRLAAVNALKGRSELTPEILQIIRARLEDTNINIRKVAINVVRGRTELPPMILQAVAAQLEGPQEDIDFRWGVVARLEDPDWDVQRTAIGALEGRSKLLSEVLQAVAAQLEDPHKDVRQVAIDVLNGRSERPPELQQLIMARLDDPDWLDRNQHWLPYSIGPWNRNLPDLAVDVLIGQSSLPFEIVNQHFQSLYRILLKRGFEEHLGWYITGEISYIGVGVRKVPLKGQQAWLKDTIREEWNDLGTPLPDVQWMSGRQLLLRVTRRFRGLFSSAKPRVPPLERGDYTYKMDSRLPG
ncbi:uncharacterized protein KD926_000776 [Aspergillus affinis]|uniref:uncharacterized protein n=1 Tax=Aspergillus affinis TaxID=1070780 RepID=UPI0022FE6956|nr:uncharacterized protein KD926_000776 [Aspergillus affinis]KAI9037202.1 hypothetical protein KD926_000776 [Aspergillus affinis]